MALNGQDTRDPRIERLYREAAREAPPVQLDAAILAAARREIGARPRGLSAALRRWHVPVSIAAIVVVSVSLVILMRDEGGERLDNLSIPPLTAPIDKSSAPPLRAPPAADLKAAAQPPVESPAAVTLGKLEDGSAAISGIGAAPSEPAPEPSARPFVASPPSPAPGVAKTTPAPADTAAPGRLETAPSASGERRSAAAEADVAQPRPMARAIVAKPAVADRLPVWQGLEKEPPEKWLARMDELTREGRTAEAEEMRAEFKRRFPDHPLGQASK